MGEKQGKGDERKGDLDMAQPETARAAGEQEGEKERATMPTAIERDGRRCMGVDETKVPSQTTTSQGRLVRPKVCGPPGFHEMPMPWWRWMA